MSNKKIRNHLLYMENKTFRENKSLPFSLTTNIPFQRRKYNVPKTLIHHNYL